MAIVHMAKREKRITIYDLAKSLNIAPSSVSKALNNSHAISSKIKKMVEDKAKELNYIHNTNAANLRRGFTRIIGVIVPKINESFFANIIAGIEKVCVQYQHSLIICQTEESLEKEVNAVKTLIRQNVDCILISLSLETQTTAHLEEIKNNHIHFIQFDRVSPAVDSYTVVNDNAAASYQAVKHLAEQGYQKIAYFGGPAHLNLYQERKKGYKNALKDLGLTFNEAFVKDEIISTENGRQEALSLLQADVKPDAFLCTSDYVSLGVLEALKTLNLTSPKDIGIIGFANEMFTQLIQPSLSSVNQFSYEMGEQIAKLYFDEVMKNKENDKVKSVKVKTEIVERSSSSR
jgi:LacI family transcriptional regulator